MSTQLHPTQTTQSSMENDPLASTGNTSDNDELFAAKPEPYTGTYEWFSIGMTREMQKINPDYDAKDPLTWLCITESCVQRYMDTRPLHPFAITPAVAYEKEALEELLKQRAALLLDASYNINLRDIGLINWRFHSFPYNFGQDGRPRERVGIPRGDYEYWMQRVHGQNWMAKYPHRAQRPHTTMEDVPGESEIQRDPATTYENIIKSLKDHNENAPETTTLQKDVEHLSQQLRQERERANLAEQNFRDQRDGSFQLAVEVVRLRRQLEDKEEQVGVAEAAAHAAHAAIVERDACVARLRAENRVADERMEKIWDEVQLVCGGSSKRPSVGGEFCISNKRGKGE